MALLKKKTSKKPRGKFIVIDGVDASGKHTQLELLAETLRVEGYDCEQISFPQYGSKSAGAVEEYLAGKYGQLDPYSASILYAVDRFDASFKIESWLSQGKTVLSDRYVTANAGHQGGKISLPTDRVKYFKWLNDFEYNVLKIPKPDLNIILHMPYQISQKLLNSRGNKKDLHEKDKTHLQNAEKVFVEIGKMFPNTRMIECYQENKLLSRQQIHNKVWNLVRRIVLNPPNKK